MKTVAARPLLASQCLRSSPRILPLSRVLLPSSSQCHRYRYSSTTATAASTYPERIAVLGGGIAGLASAYFVSKEFPKSRITIFEAGKETGGWIKSKRVDLPNGGGNILFELGPRTLRNATPTASLIQDLGLINDVTYTKRTEVGAKNRFIYFPDRLNRLPSERPSLTDLLKLWRTGILGGALGVLKEPLIPTRPRDMSDETVGSFIARRLDKRIAENIVSAVFHGIYAGDIWQLSARTLLSQAWQLEAKYGSALGGFFRMQSEDQRGNMVALAHPYDVEVAKAMNEEIDLDEDFARELSEAAMFTFKGGLQQLVRALQGRVEEMGNVVVRTESPVLEFKPLAGGDGVEVVSGVRFYAHHFSTDYSFIHHQPNPTQVDFSTFPINQTHPLTHSQPHN